MLPFMILYIITVQGLCPVTHATSWLDCLAKCLIAYPADHYDNWFQQMYGPGLIGSEVRRDAARHWLERI